MIRLIHPNDSRRPGGTYRVSGDPCPVDRPNRTAAGMSAQLFRKKMRTRRQPKLSDLALRLTVRGTLDPLAGHGLYLVKKVCPCCASKSGKLELGKNPTFKGSRALRLKAMRLNPERLP